ncbi:MAG: hypothetical protein ACOC5T_07230, partial [Elusimicrobiota bacterium]
MTEYFLGTREQISWGDENTFGTAVTPTEIVGKNVQIQNPNFSKGWIDVDTAGSDTREIESKEKGNKLYRFTLSFVPTSGKFLKYSSLGNIGTSGSDPYTHTLSLKNEVNSFTLEWAKRGNTNKVITLKGCVMKNVKLRFDSEGENGGFIRVEAECIAQDLSTGSSVTSLSNVSKDGFQFRMVKLTVEGNEVK